MMWQARHSLSIAGVADSQAVSRAAAAAAEKSFKTTGSARADLADRDGAVVAESVESGGPASKAGVAVGDVLVLS